MMRPHPQIMDKETEAQKSEIELLVNVSGKLTTGICVATDRVLAQQLAGVGRNQVLASSPTWSIASEVV